MFRPVTSGRPIVDLGRHFESKLIVGHSGGHWSLATKVNNKGYHVISVGAGAREYAHRVAYRLFVGSISSGLEIDHACRVRWCCNPAHLEAVTHSENLRRAHPTCKKGHPMTQMKARRVCIPCRDQLNSKRKGVRGCSGPKT